MTTRGHPYKTGEAGRALRTQPGIGGLSRTAQIQCSTCPKQGELKIRTLFPPEQIDQKFTQAGWSIDPHLCPDCRLIIPRKPKMAAQPSPNAMKTQAAMFRLLSNHFDVDTGRYEKDWGDARIAKETGLSVALVSQFRDAGFGEIKEAPEIAGLRADVRALEQLAREHHETIKNEIAALSFRIAKLTGESAR